MKKRISSIVLVLVIIFATFSFAACSENDSTTTTTTKVKAQTITIVIGALSPTIYEVEPDRLEIKEGLISVLEYLNQKHGLKYTAEDSGYGSYLTKVGDLSQRDNNYIYIYTTVEKDFDVSQYAKTIRFGGKTLTSAGVGASELTIEAGCTIYIGTIAF